MFTVIDAFARICSALGHLQKICADLCDTLRELKAKRVELILVFLFVIDLAALVEVGGLEGEAIGEIVETLQLLLTGAEGVYAR